MCGYQGVAPPAVDRVHVTGEGFDEEVPVEPTTGAFLVGLPRLPDLSSFSVAPAN
jgi:hypothetical protein